MKFLVLANGPGEAWGWARPLCHALQKRGHDLVIACLPCPFSSGREARALRALGFEVEDLGALGPLRAAQKLKALSRSFGAQWTLQLGGDLMFGRLAKGKGKLACYSYGPKKGMKACNLLLAPRENSWGAKVVGDLTRESLSDEEPLTWKAPQGKRFLLLPGSRPAIRNLALKLMAPLAAWAAEVGGQWRVPLSPFCDQGEVEEWRKAGFDAYAADLGACTAGATAALTQPGTNTLQLMERGVPMIVAAPLDFAAHIPLSGLKGLVPVWAKRPLIKALMARRKGFLAWPNRLAGFELCPEYLGDVSPRFLAQAMGQFVAQGEKLTQISEQLLLLAQATPPASERIVELLEGR